MQQGRPFGRSETLFVTPDTRLVIAASTPATSSPSGAGGCSFADIAEKPDARLMRYSLTPRAASGVLWRAVKYGYRLPPALLEALLSCIRRGSAR